MERKISELREMAHMAKCTLIVKDDDIYLITYKKKKKDKNQIDQQFHYDLSEKGSLDSVYRNLTSRLEPQVKDLAPSFLMLAPFAFELGYEIKIIDYYASLRTLSKDGEESKEVQRYPIVKGPDELSDFLTSSMLNNRLEEIIPKEGKSLTKKRAEQIVQAYDGLLPTERQKFRDTASATMLVHIDTAIEMHERAIERKERKERRKGKEDGTS